jgi:hypothetical protein
MEWFIATKTGRTVTATLLFALGVLGSYLYFGHKKFEAGYAACQAEHAKAESKAKTGLINERADEAKGGAEIASKASDAATKTNDTIDAQTAQDKRKIDNEYRKPVAPSGACYGPVPVGVQNVIDAAVQRANQTAAPARVVPAAGNAARP